MNNSTALNLVKMTETNLKNGKRRGSIQTKTFFLLNQVWIIINTKFWFIFFKTDIRDIVESVFSWNEKDVENRVKIQIQLKIKNQV